MLERFKVKDDHAVRVGVDPLRETVAGVFEKMDVPTEDARLAADVLVTADLRGCGQPWRVQHAAQLRQRV